MKYHGKITYTIGKNHPDIQYVPDWREGKFYTTEDEYTFSEDYSKENIITYIKNDLSLVAGGGYNTDHIHNVMFDIEKI